MSTDAECEELCVLVADDDEDLRELLARSLGRTGHRVVGAGDGDEALELVRRDHPDVVILDWVMPGMQGHEVCRRIKSDPRTRDIPVVMLSAHGTEEDVREGFVRGADEYVTKPFDLDELNHVVASVTVRPDRSDQRREHSFPER